MGYAGNFSNVSLLGRKEIKLNSGREKGIGFKEKNLLTMILSNICFFIAKMKNVEKQSMQWCGSGLIVSGSRSIKSPKWFQTSFRSKKKKNLIFKYEPKH